MLRRLLVKLLATAIGLFHRASVCQATLLCVRYFSPLFALARPCSGGVRHVFTPIPCCWSVLFRHPFMWGSSRWVPSVGSIPIERTCDWVLRFCRIAEHSSSLVPTSKRQPFLSQSIYVPGCLAICVLAPRPLVRALACV